MAEKRLIDANAYAFPGDLIYEPTIDAVEVVRCRDCKYVRETGKNCFGKDFVICDHPDLEWDVECFDHWLGRYPDDFCSQGERRDADV